MRKSLATLTEWTHCMKTTGGSFGSKTLSVQKVLIFTDFLYFSTNFDLIFLVTEIWLIFFLIFAQSATCTCPCKVEFITSRTFMNCSWSFMKSSWLVHDWFIMMVHELYSWIYSWNIVHELIMNNQEHSYKLMEMQIFFEKMNHHEFMNIYELLELQFIQDSNIFKGYEHSWIFMNT